MRGWGISLQDKRTFSGRAVVVFVYECVEPVCVVYWRVDVHRRRPVSRFHVAWLSSLNTRILDKKKQAPATNKHPLNCRSAALHFELLFALFLVHLHLIKRHVLR